MLAEKDGFRAVVADWCNLWFRITALKKNKPAFPSTRVCSQTSKIIHHKGLCKASDGSFPGVVGSCLLLKASSHLVRKHQYYINNYSEIWNLKNLAMSAVLEWRISVPGRHLQEPFPPRPRSSHAVTQQGPTTSFGADTGPVLREWWQHTWYETAVSSNEILAHLVPSSTSPKHPSEYVIFPLLGACRSHTSTFYTQPGTWQKHDLLEVTSSWKQSLV